MPGPAATPGGPDPSVAGRAALEALAALLDSRYYSTSLLTGPGRAPRLTVASRYVSLAEDVYADDGWYWSGQATKIAPFTHPAAAAHDLRRILGGHGAR